MKLKVVAIGNSRGIRIPKPLLEQAGIRDEVEIEADGNALILRAPLTTPRADWEAAFQKMAKLSDDTLLHPEWIAAEWDDEEWEWN